MPFPYEWATKVLCDDKTASQTLTYVHSVTFEWATAELVAIQPLMDWLRAASCNAKPSQKIQQRHRYAQTGQCPAQIARKLTGLEHELQNFLEIVLQKFRNRKSLLLPIAKG